MKILITGSTGAIGSNLTPWLEKNNEVVALKSDVRDKLSLEDEIHPHTDADWIINLAGIVNTDLCNLAKRHAYDVNVIGAENVAKTAKNYGIKLCHFSTTAFYKPTDLIREDSAVEPQTWYGTTKYLGELAVRKVLNDDVLVIRPCFAFGGDNDRSLASRLIYSAYYHEPIVVQLNPIYKKDYMHVLNLCDAIEKVLETGYIGNVNISVGQPIAFGDVVETAKKVVGKDPFIYWVPEDDYMKDHIVDHTKFMSLVDWKPTITLEEGMKIVFEKIKKVNTTRQT
jgi:nucleoside-diphosphate-sugar epimerase